ncbi:MAG: hypothetical protein GF421_03875 [Candidatus Aminicenantes bacterium]|nr:hypothetical protein [Candidatus Aminicenantes bacterium]
MRASNRLLTLYVMFIGLALISFLGLDFIAWKGGETSVVFSMFSHQDQIPEAQENIIHRVHQALLSTDIKDQDLSQYTDKNGICHIMVRLSRKDYSFLEKTLEESLSSINASVRKKQETQKEHTEYFLWEVVKKGETPVSLLFSIDLKKESTQPVQVPVYENTAAIIIDDMGYSVNSIHDICSLNTQFTVAVLPFSPLAQETATIARQNGLEVILHLPLESINNIYDNTHTLGIINTDMDPNKILETLNINLNKVPYISGINTHMGSKVTKDKALMGIILEHLIDKNLYFIDSRTTAHSVAYDMAQNLSIPSAYRHVFLDSQTEPEYIKNQLIKLFQTAQKNGQAVGIGHPFPETLQVLKQNMHLADKFKISLVPASKIVH